MKRWVWTLALAGVAVASTASAEWRFAVGLQGGVQSGGRLYRASANEVQNWRWEIPAGQIFVDRHSGTEILVESGALLDENSDFAGLLEFGLRITMLQDHGPWGGILSLQLQDADVNATVRRTTGAVDTVPWDQFFTTSVELAGTYSFLPAQTSTPFVLAGLAFVSLQSEGSSLDQSKPGLVLGAGWRTRALPGVFDLELRGTWIPLDLDDEEARLRQSIEQQSQTADPQFAFDDESALLSIGVSASWSLLF